MWTALLGPCQEAVRRLEKGLQEREHGVELRQAEAERKLLDAAQTVSGAREQCRRELELEYMELKAGLQRDRMQLEVSPGAIMHR
jgi:hypothetical protein